MSEEKTARDATECPCPRECPRHGNCRECVAYHNRTTLYLPCCQRKRFKSVLRKKDPPPAAK